MSISSMGIRASLATAQADRAQPEGPSVVVSALASRKDAGALGPSYGQPTSTDFTETGERIAAWIPSEALGIFITIVAAFPGVYDSGRDELIVVGTVALLTGLFAYVNAERAHARRALNRGKTKASVITALMAITSFGVWWMATPGTYIGDDLGLQNLWLFLIVTVYAAIVPFVAQFLGIEPKT